MKSPNELQFIAEKIAREFSSELDGLDWTILVSDSDKKDFLAISSNECVVCLTRMLINIIEAYNVDHLEDQPLSQNMFTSLKSRVN